MRKKLNGNLTAVWIGIALTVALNIAGIAYGYGGINERVNGINARLDRIERSLDSKVLSWLK